MSKSKMSSYLVDLTRKQNRNLCYNLDFYFLFPLPNIYSMYVLEMK